MQKKEINAFGRRLNEACFLYSNGAYEGALLSTLVAIGGASRIRFPRGTKSQTNPKKEMSDSEAFVAWLDEEFDKRRLPHAVMWGGVKTNTNQIIYKWLRCSLAHAAQLPFEIILDTPKNKKVAGFQACTRNASRMHVHQTTILMLAQFVAESHEVAPIPCDVFRRIGSQISGIDTDVFAAATG